MAFFDFQIRINTNQQYILHEIIMKTSIRYD